MKENKSTSEHENKWKQKASKLNSIEVIGLMNIAPLGCSQKMLEGYFSQMKKLQEYLEHFVQR